MRLALFALLALVASPPDLAPVNAVAGDASWIALHGAPPTADTPDDDRIATHLLWVEAHLRAATPDLSAEARAEREHLLDVLHDYALARPFPRNDAAHGVDRLPRWVDPEGRHCAVAALVEASGEAELVREVLARHEYDYVPDMHEPALVIWAGAHGFTAAELALIQPTYPDGSGVEMPSPEEERFARERAARAARVPRPLTRDQVRAVITRYLFDARTTCAADLTGHWQVHTTLRVDRRLRVHATVEARDAAGRVTALEACLADAATTAMQAVIRSANHHVRAPIEEAHDGTLDVYDGGEIDRALALDPRPWRSEGTRQTALAACMAHHDAPVEILVRVAGWNGFVSIRWADLGATPISMPREEAAFWYCVQDVLTYGALEAHGVRDHDATLVLSADGTLAVSP